MEGKIIMIEGSGIRVFAEPGYVLTHFEDGMDILEYNSMRDVKLPMERNALNYARDLRVITEEEDMEYMQAKVEEFESLIYLLNNENNIEMSGMTYDNQLQ